MVAPNSIVIDLTNTDNAPYAWNLGGGNLGLPAVERKTTYVGNPGEAATTTKPGSYIGTASEVVPVEQRTYIPTPSEAMAAKTAILEQAADLQRQNEQMKAMPLRVNKIRIFTDNPLQYKEAFTYYEQNADGTYQSRRLNVLVHYNHLLPQPKVEIGREYLGGELILDGHRRIEVKSVLPKTMLLIELLFEQDDPVDLLTGKANSSHKASAHKADEQEPDEQEDEQEADQAQAPKDVFDEALIGPFVDSFYEPAARSRRITGVPVLFALGQAALERGWDIDRLGNNMFGVKAGDRWQGPFVSETETICLPPAEDDSGAVSFQVEPKSKACEGKTAYLVTTRLREYASPYASFNDRARLWQKKPYQPAFAFQALPYEFARQICQAGYGTGEDYAHRLVKFMEAIEPFLAKWERLENSKKRAERQRKAVLVAVTGVLIFVLTLALFKPLLFKKLLLL
jgi:flagellum-specific peptidoglycan hydrolase FlgJ